MTEIDLSQFNLGNAVFHDQPYTMRGFPAVIDRDFFDRREVKEKVFTLLQAPASNKPVVIIGERRSGKTSLVKLISFNLSNDPHKIIVSVPYTSVYSSADLIQEFLGGLFSQIDMLLPDDKDFRTDIRRIGTTSEFLIFLQYLCKYLEGKTIILLIDELDSILVDNCQGEEKGKVLGIINALVEASYLPIKMVLTTTIHPDKWPALAHSSLVYHYEPIQIQPFSAPDLQEMCSSLCSLLHEKIVLQEADQARLYELSGGWPFFGKMVLSYLVQFPRSGQDSLAWFKLAVEKALQDTRLSVALNQIYERTFDDNERAVILYLQKGPISVQEASGIESRFQEALQRLLNRDYLEIKTERYEYRSKLVEGWFRQWERLEEQLKYYLKKDGLPLLDRPVNEIVSRPAEIIKISRAEIHRRRF
jgi:hypothetical protein